MVSTDTQPLSKKANQLRLLNELSTKLQSLLQSENFNQEIVDTIQHRFDYHSIQIWTVAEDGSYTLRAQAGVYRNHLKIGHTLQVNQGITGFVIRSRKSYLCNDVSKDPNYTDLSLPIHSQSELCVPVLRDGVPVATLNMESDKHDAFDEDDVITLEAVASQVSVAMVNRKLYSEATSFNKKLQLAVEE